MHHVHTVCTAPCVHCTLWALHRALHSLGSRCALVCRDPFSPSHSLRTVCVRPVRQPATVVAHPHATVAWSLGASLSSHGALFLVTAPPLRSHKPDMACVGVTPRDVMSVSRPRHVGGARAGLTWRQHVHVWRLSITQYHRWEAGIDRLIDEEGLGRCGEPASLIPQASINDRLIDEEGLGPQARGGYGPTMRG